MKKLYKFTYNFPVRLRLRNGAMIYCKPGTLTFLEDDDYKDYKSYFVEERTSDRKVIEEKDVISGKVELNAKHTYLKENEVEPEMTKDQFKQVSLAEFLGAEKKEEVKAEEIVEDKVNEIEKDDNIFTEKMEETNESGSLQEDESVHAAAETERTEEVPATEETVEAEQKTEEVVNEEPKKKGRKRK